MLKSLFTNAFLPIASWIYSVFLDVFLLCEIYAILKIEGVGFHSIIHSNIWKKDMSWVTWDRYRPGIQTDNMFHRGVRNNLLNSSTFHLCANIKLFHSGNRNRNWSSWNHNFLTGRVDTLLINKGPFNIIRDFLGIIINCIMLIMLIMLIKIVLET